MKIEPIYQNDYVTLYQGDCLEIMPQLDVKFDACITDPPYGTITKMNNDWDIQLPMDQIWLNMNNLIKENGAICLFGQQPFSSLLRCSNLKDFRYDWIWKKSHCCNFLCAKKQPMKTHEIISLFYKKQPTYNPQMTKGKPYVRINQKKQLSMSNGYLYGIKQQFSIYNQSGERYPTSIISYANNNYKRLHTCQKPVELIEYLIKTYTNEGDTVLDFTAGSGTTGVACMNTKRKCVLIQMEDKYCQIIINRLQNHEPSEQTKKIRKVKKNDKQMDLFDDGD